jgi:hypothetical protein
LAVRPQSLRFGVAPSPYTPLSGQHRAGFAWHDSLPGWRRLRARDLAPRVPPSLITVVRGTGILTRCPSPTAQALGLGPPHPQLISMAAEPSGIRWGGFAPPSRYSCRHSHSPPLHLGSRLGFSADGDAPLPWLSPSAASVTGLSPGGLSAPRHSRPVSYYALFQGWLLLSQPPGCLRAATTLPTEPVVRDLSRRSGLFPSRRRIFAPAVSRPPPAWSSKRSTRFRGIRRLVRVGKREAPSPIQRDTSAAPHGGAAPKCISGRTSYLRVRLAFHRYPQLIRTFCNRSRFGPPQACSARFSLATGRSPGFGSFPDDSSPFRTRVRSGSACPWLSLAAWAHSSAHSTKGTPSQGHALLRPAGSAWFQDLFHSPRRGAFHRSLTVLVHYRSLAVCSLGAWSPLLPAGCHVSGGTHDLGSQPGIRGRLRDSHPLR